MRFGFLLTGALVALLHACPSLALDESLAREYGKNRVKIQRLEAPKEISQSKLQAARARYEVRMEQCRGLASRNKQYCMQEAETQLMMDERKIRDQARKEEAQNKGAD
jgi:hypothetical protein